jgi:hypothetical protein
MQVFGCEHFLLNMMMEMRLLWLRVGVLRNVSLETVEVSLQVRTCNTSAEKILLSIWNMGFMAPKSVQYWNICLVSQYFCALISFLFMTVAVGCDCLWCV